MRAYLRVDPNLPEQKADYPDGAYRAFVDTLCLAEQQPKRGRFRNRRLLAVLLEKRARWITYLVEHGDLIELPSGALYVDGWDEWQEGDVTVSERMRRLRSRRRDVTPPDTPAVTVPTVTRPYSGGGGGSTSRGGDAAPSRAANGQGPAAEGLPNGNAMGFRPRRPTAAEMAADVRRQEQAEWAKCADCGGVRRTHRPSDEHPFQARQGAPA